MKIRICSTKFGNNNKDSVKKQHFVHFMIEILDKDHAEIAPPLEDRVLVTPAYWRLSSKEAEFAAYSMLLPSLKESHLMMYF